MTGRRLLNDDGEVTCYVERKLPLSMTILSISVEESTGKAAVIGRPKGSSSRAWLVKIFSLIEFSSRVLHEFTVADLQFVSHFFLAGNTVAVGPANGPHFGKLSLMHLEGDCYGHLSLPLDQLADLRVSTWFIAAIPDVEKKYPAILYVWERRGEDFATIPLEIDYAPGSRSKFRFSGTLALSGCTAGLCNFLFERHVMEGPNPTLGWLRTGCVYMVHFVFSRGPATWKVDEFPALGEPKILRRPDPYPPLFISVRSPLAGYLGRRPGHSHVPYFQDNLLSSNSCNFQVTGSSHGRLFKVGGDCQYSTALAKVRPNGCVECCEIGRLDISRNARELKAKLWDVLGYSIIYVNGRALIFRQFDPVLSHHVRGITDCNQPGAHDKEEEDMEM